jgi:hypothetical protein
LGNGRAASVILWLVNLLCHQKVQSGALSFRIPWSSRLAVLVTARLLSQASKVWPVHRSISNFDSLGGRGHFVGANATHSAYSVGLKELCSNTWACDLSLVWDFVRLSYSYILIVSPDRLTSYILLFTCILFLEPFGVVSLLSFNDLPIIQGIHSPSRLVAFGLRLIYCNHIPSFVLLRPPLAPIQPEGRFSYLQAR